MLGLVESDAHARQCRHSCSNTCRAGRDFREADHSFDRARSDGPSRLGCWVRSILEQKVTKVTKGESWVQGEEDQGGRSRGRFDYGWRLSPGERLMVVGLTPRAGVGKIGAAADLRAVARGEESPMKKNALTITVLTLVLAIIPDGTGLADGSGCGGALRWQDARRMEGQRRDGHVQGRGRGDRRHDRGGQPQHVPLQGRLQGLRARTRRQVRPPAQLGRPGPQPRL